jgi:hypothetical protein
MTGFASVPTSVAGLSWQISLTRSVKAKHAQVQKDNGEPKLAVEDAAIAARVGQNLYCKLTNSFRPRASYT